MSSGAIGDSKINLFCDWTGTRGPRAYYVGRVNFNFQDKSSYYVDLPSNPLGDKIQQLSFNCCPENSSDIVTVDKLETTIGKIQRLTIEADYFDKDGNRKHGGAVRIFAMPDKVKPEESLRILLQVNLNLGVSATFVDARDVYDAVDPIQEDSKK